MNATVILPTYRRPESLPWALASILLQRRSGKCKVVVVNNGGDEAQVDDAVESTVARFGTNGWLVATTHRRPPLDPVTSWYKAIFDEGADGDAVLLHGDDDLLLPGSLEERCRGLEATDATVLLTRSSSRLFFDSETPGTVLIGGNGLREAPVVAVARRVDIGDALTWDPGFIGNHAYRLGNALRQAYQRARADALGLPLEPHVALTVVPFLLPVYVAQEAGVAGSMFVACVRGQSRQTVTMARFGHINWMPGIIYAASLRLLNTGFLGARVDLEPWRRSMRHELASWYIPTVAIPATRAQLAALGYLGLRQQVRESPAAVVRGARLALASLLGIQGIRLRSDILARAGGYKSVAIEPLLREIFATRE